MYGQKNIKIMKEYFGGTITHENLILVCKTNGKKINFEDKVYEVVG
jgi:hypothetical protein